MTVAKLLARSIWGCALWRALCLMLCLAMLSPVWAQPAQTPLLTRSTAVEPNIMVVFDDSGSMQADWLYQDNSAAAWGGTAPEIGGYGVDPLRYVSTGWNPSASNLASVTYAKCSPDVNQLYYDPGVRYYPPVDASGNYLPNASTAGPWSTTVVGGPLDGFGSNVCMTSGGAPIIYRYWNRSQTYVSGKPYTSASSYTGTWTITSSITAYPAANMSGGPNKAAARTDCAGATTCTYAEEIQNFANWFTWHRTRIDMAKTAFTQALTPPDSSPLTGFRLGWTKLSTAGSSSPSIGANVQSYNSTVRSNFTNFLNNSIIGFGSGYNLGGTPTRIAIDNVGQFYQRTDSDGPWGTNPRAASTSITTPGSVTSTESSSAHAACRRSVAMLMTDGYWTDSFSSVGNVDNTTGGTITAPGGGTYRYTPAYPYRDGASDTLADIAMRYWVTDLRTNLSNRVPTVPGLDNAFWQHMNFYAIGLGIDGSIPQTATNLAKLSSGTTTWPTPTANSIQAVDDMWHATINGRGAMLNAGNASTLSTALRSMVNQIVKASASQAGVAVSTANLVSGTQKFVPVYTTGEWTGNLIANNLDPVTGNETTIAWQVENKDAVTGLELSNTLAPDLSVAFTSRSPAARRIAVGANTTGLLGLSTSGPAVPFTYADMNTIGLMGEITPAFSGQTVDSILIDYLRGDRTYEGPSTTRNYRQRSLILGDIVNSTPQFVKPAIDYGYSKLPAGTPGASTYNAFLTTKAARTEGALFIGSNDGMLHAFAEADGREVFAYVPRAVLPNIAKLADPGYQHRYFVDGPVTQTDFYNGSAWKNVVMGTTGAGAKAVFAIDATTPTSISHTNVLWEIRSSMTDFAELGHVLSDVQAGRMRNGQWAAVIGNGFYSASGKAQLFVVNMADGSLIRKIDTLAGPNNGLGGVSLVLNTNNEVIGAYGGDLLGNMWKFDLSDTSPSNWKVGFGTASSPVPLYKAKDSSGTAQPITAAPFVMTHPNGGYLVSFATGKFHDDSDLTSTGVQSAYGLRDTATFGVTPSPNPTTSQISGTSTLVQQTVNADITVTRTITSFDNSTSSQVISYFNVSTNTITWTSNQGWYFNLPNSGQRNVYPIGQIVGQIIRMDTIKPFASSSDPCSSSSSGIGYSYLIDSLTGGSPIGPIFDTNGDGVVNVLDDSNASGIVTNPARNLTVNKSTSTATKKDFCLLGSSGECTLGQVDLCKQPGANCSPPLKSTARRTWRQLFLR